MREIKFRAWDTAGKTYSNSDAIVISSNGIVFDREFMVPLTDSPYILEEYIGLEDKNGTEIYGGTISQTITKDGIKLSKFVYFYNEGLARFQKRRDDGEVFDCDAVSEGGKIIIGTIHENPELLK